MVVFQSLVVEFINAHLDNSTPPSGPSPLTSLCNSDETAATGRCHGVAGETYVMLDSPQTVRSVP